MDDETRYWIAKEVADTKDRYDARGLFEAGKKVTGTRRWVNLRIHGERDPEWDNIV
jgi:hypothetical protein